ncbi:glycosyltransferase family 2 protein [Thermococcus barophilus]|uniref:Glycosyltransferase 2-like domain-containing protein n=1 Tax=Thermococcus barophilus TaxID=55802 RepID=A0A0S1XF19_THEBA|nr:glycosyltransferase family 2 protein [Thermococcus barophilus]ALM76391.1 hypothetical protein TBCH5v1_2500 [Thermococcus barophilus]
MLPRVSIIILNWNGWKDTIECLESLYRITYPNYDVIVVDNASQDDSIQKIKEYCEGKIKINSKFFDYNPNNKPIKVFEISEDEAEKGKFNRQLYEKYPVERRMIIIENKGNYGFAGGNNVGIKFALKVLNSDYVLILNNDTVVDPNFLNEMINVAMRDEKIGICGPKIYYYNIPNMIWHAGGYVNFWTGKYGYKGWTKDGRGEIDKGQYDKISEELFVSGCCMLISKKVLTQVGLFDESFFFGSEESDIGIRANNAGFKVVYVPNSKIWHKVSATVKREFSFASLRLIESRLILFRKHCSRLQLVVISGFYAFRFIRSLFLYPITSHSKDAFKYYRKAFSVFLDIIKSSKKQRSQRDYTYQL